MVILGSLQEKFNFVLCYLDEVEDVRFGAQENLILKPSRGCSQKGIEKNEMAIVHVRIPPCKT